MYRIQLKRVKIKCFPYSYCSDLDLKMNIFLLQLFPYLTFRKKIVSFDGVRAISKNHEIRSSPTTIFLM